MYVLLDDAAEGGVGCSEVEAVNAWLPAPKVCVVAATGPPKMDCPGVEGWAMAFLDRKKSVALSAHVTTLCELPLRWKGEKFSGRDFG
ncbi:unnamed protein product [Fusarium graminearum]|nr:unnamed protein product [Fusarium graminearum]CAG2004077.1 unnamed protein product [Fusarium graminearum]VTO91372.1 unnamed protein product [Fusarium graminearum]